MIGTLLRQHYRITKKLGEGGFGETYIAQDLDLPGNPECVLKRLKASSNAAIIERLFQEEAITLQKLGEHDQIPRLLAYFEENGEFYLVQSLIVGHGLEQEITPGKQLSESYVIALLKSVLEPLCFVHQNQVVHRDIKPANLIRRKQDGKIVLIDFGAVKEIAATRVVTGENTQLTVAIGTPGYMPSEQSRGRPRFSSDIYGLGMVGIQALTGKMPEYLQEDMDTGEIIWRNQINAGVNEQLLAILDCMVRYDFRQRYSSAQEALEIVQQLASNSTSSTTYQLNTTPQQLLPTAPSTPPNSPPSVPPQYRQEIPNSPPSPPPNPQLQGSSSSSKSQHLVKPLIGKLAKAEIRFLWQWILATIVGFSVSFSIFFFILKILNFPIKK